MVFSSHAFLVFLVLVLAGYGLIARWREPWAKHFLTAASLVFYGFWIPAYLLLLMGSVLVNYALAGRIRHHLPADPAAPAAKAWRWMALGVALNLGLIGYYKYLDFFITSLNWGLGLKLPLQHILLPIGISFITFQKISFLVDTYHRKVGQVPFADFLFFIAFFPQLIAGPIVTQADFLPQMRERRSAQRPEGRSWRLDPWHVAIGLAIFSAGLFKKTILADQVAPYADHVFNTAAQGLPLGLLDAWVGATSYSFQIYFDFSGYSDMAIGLAFLFGFRLPINFFSPYKAASIREFWRRWHISLSSFLRDYLYISLGGSRHGWWRTLLALMATMTLGGLWHGANITFVVWGMLHGALLVVNHAWAKAGIDVSAWLGGRSWLARSLRHLIAVVITWVLVTFIWVFFRANDLATALGIVKAMLGLTTHVSFTPTTYGVVTFIWLYFLLAWLLPNTAQIFQRFEAYLHAGRYIGGPVGGQVGGAVGGPDSASAARAPGWAYKLNAGWAVLAALSFSIAWFALSNLSPFIYFQF